MEDHRASPFPEDITSAIIEIKRLRGQLNRQGMEWGQKFAEQALELKMLRERLDSTAKPARKPRKRPT